MTALWLLGDIALAGAFALYVLLPLIAGGSDMAAGGDQ
jgi:hypothetical protein